ncbi:MAG: imidazole glycerol phosphate synthase subunit HisH [Mycobacterium leprae]
MTQIVIVDYDMGNLPSVQKAFKAVGYDTVVTADQSVIADADGLVLPGVGAFAAGMRHLAERDLVQAVREYAYSGRPLLGICVGMQLLFEVGEEFGETPGLGLLEGRVTRLPDTVKLPQIGWNQVDPVKEHPIFAGVESPFYAYYVHSFAADQVEAEDIAAVTEYGRTFPAMVARENLIGIQFHPEKSSRVGLGLLANFGRIVCHSNSTPRSI